MSLPKKDNLQKKVAGVLESVRPQIQAHGGDLELMKIEGKKVTIKVSGACLGCPMAQQTFNEGVEGLIREEAPEVKEIKFVG